MANNVLTGVVQITAPGAAAVFQGVADNAKKTETALKSSTLSVSKFGDTLETLKAKLGARQSFLNVEKDVAKIAILNNEIKVLQDEISRVGNIGKSGFDEFGNTLTKTIGPLEQVGGGATKMLSVLRNVAYVLPGIGLAGLIGGLSDLVIGLFDTSLAFSDAELKASQFTVALEQQKEGLRQYLSFLDNNASEGKLRAKLNAITAGGGAEIEGFKIDKAKNDEIINQLTALNDKLVEKTGNIRSNAQFFLKASAQKLLESFADIDIPDDLIYKLNKTDRDILTEFKQNALSIDENRKEIAKRTRENNSSDIQSQTKLAEDQRALHDKAAADYARYVSETIAQAKKLSAAFKDSISLKLNIGALDTKQDEFKKSLSFLKDFGDNNFKFTFTPAIDIKNIEFPPADVLPVATEFGTMFSKELNDYFKQPGQITDFGLIQAVNDSKPHAQTAAEKLAATFNNSFSGALAGGLESIGEGIGNALSGKDFGTQIFQVFGSLFSSIGKALIEFGIIRKGIEQIFKNPLIPAVIPIALGIAAVAAGQLFKNIKGARALGGNVGAGDEYLVGERGPEIFRPNTGGRIIPNNQIGTGSSRQQGGLMVQVAGSTTVKGQDLLIAFTLANQSKLRLQ